MTLSLPVRQYGSNSPLSETDWQNFFQRGYCVIRALLSEQERQKTRTALEGVVAQARQLASTQDKNFDGIAWSNGAQFVLKTDQKRRLQQLHRVCGCGSVAPILLQISRHPLLLNAFADILLSRQFEQLICQFHPKLPGDDVAFKPHRDIEFRLHGNSKWVDINHWGSYVVAVMSIDNAGSKNGGLTVVPDSHLNVNLLDIKPASTDFDPLWKDKAVRLELAAGDVLLMHPYLVHWSGVNKGNKPRFALLSGVSSPGANHRNYPGDCTNEILSV